MIHPLYLIFSELAKVVTNNFFLDETGWESVRIPSLFGEIEMRDCKEDYA